MLDYILGNTFMKFGSFIFQQICGVPMGGNASPIIADLTLSALEYRYLSSTAHKKESKLLKFSIRYIDDLLNINCSEFLPLCNKIYPASLPLEATNTKYEKIHNFLDITIDHSKGCILKLYDKRNDFSFEVVKFTHADSNVHSQLGYNVFYSQCIRIARICNSYKDFKTEIKILFAIFVKNKYNKIKLEKQLLKFMGTYSALTAKYYVDFPCRFLRFIKNDLILL